MSATCCPLTFSRRQENVEQISGGLSGLSFIEERRKNHGTRTSLQMCQPPPRGPHLDTGEGKFSLSRTSPPSSPPPAEKKNKTKTTTTWWPNNQKYAFSAGYFVIPARKPDHGTLRMSEVGLDENSHKLS